MQKSQSNQQQQNKSSFKVKQTKEFEEAQQDLDIMASKAAISFKNQGQEPDQKLTNAVNTDCDDNAEFEDAATTFGKVKSTYE